MPSEEPVRWDEILAHAQHTNAHIPYLWRLGGRIIVGLLVVIFGVFVWIGVYALVTLPHPSEFPNYADYKEQRAAWGSEVKDLLQLLVVALLIPLLSTVIGYIFGRREGSAT